MTDNNGSTIPTAPSRTVAGPRKAKSPVLTRHTISVLVENKPGVLTRVTALFARRGFNIVSLAVSPTETEKYSRITAVADVADVPLERITKQLNKLVNVIKVVQLEPERTVLRELMLVKVKAGSTTRAEVLEISQIFRAKVVDVSAESVTIEATGSTEKLGALLRMLEPFSVRELVTSGAVAIGRGSRSITDRTSKGA